MAGRACIRAKTARCFGFDLDTTNTTFRLVIIKRNRKVPYRKADCPLHFFCRSGSAGALPSSGRPVLARGRIADFFKLPKTAIGQGCISFALPAFLCFLHVKKRFLESLFPKRLEANLTFAIIVYFCKIFGAPNRYEAIISCTAAPHLRGDKSSDIVGPHLDHVLQS